MIDPSSSQTVWLIEHERDNPLLLTQREYPPDGAHAELTRILRAHVVNGLRVNPSFTTIDIGRRYDVHDASGWCATYWLSEEPLAPNVGMLTAIVSPTSRQRAHHTYPVAPE